MNIVTVSVRTTSVDAFRHCIHTDGCDAMAKLRYSDFAHRIDIDALVEELQIDFIATDGDEMKAHCPLPYNSHANGDTTGKFSINRDKRVYGCWVCGGGNLLDLVMAMKDLDPEPAIKWLYQFANHEETDEEFLDFLDELLADPADKQPQMPYFNTRALDKFEPAFGHPWLAERGISEQAAGQFHLRFNAKARRTNGDIAYEGPAIYLPHFWRDRLVGWQQRWLDADTIGKDKEQWEEGHRPFWVPKYTMTPDFPKNETLFGYDRALIWLRDGLLEELVVVESVPSALYLWSRDVPAVATFGSGVDEMQLRLLRKFPRIITAPDNDPPPRDGGMAAGLKWQAKITEYLERFVSIYNLPPLRELGPKADINDLAAYDDKILATYLESAYDPAIEL